MPRLTKDKKSGLEFQRVRDAQGRTHLVPVGADVKLAIRREATNYPFEQETAETIADLHTQGLNFKQIANKLKIPVSVIYRWIRVKPAFKELMFNARQARAFHFEEKAIEAAETADEDTVQAERLRVDTYKWAAEVNNPSTFGKKGVSEGSGGVTVIVNTGVPKPEIEVKAEVIEAESVE